MVIPGGLPDFDQLWDYDDPLGTERRFLQILPFARESRRFPYLAELLTQIARSRGLQRRFSEARQTLDEAENLVTEADVRVKIRILLERGRLYNSSKKPEKARPLFLAAWGLAKQADEDVLAVDAAHMMAIIETPEKSLEWNRKAVEFTIQSTQPEVQQWLGSLYNNIGWTYHELGEYQQALSYFEKALQVRKDQGKEKERRIAAWCVARALRSLNRLDDAFAMQKELLAENQAAGKSSGFVYEELAECCLALNRAEEAREYFRLAYQELSKDSVLMENEPARLERRKGLGQVDVSLILDRSLS